MVDKEYKKKAHELVKRAKEKGLVTKYKDFCKTEEANKEEYIKFAESLKEMQLHREGKIALDTWEEYLEKKGKNNV